MAKLSRPKIKKDAPLEAGPFRLFIKDFGPINHAEIHLRPLTVFIGPSGSGKSFAATAVCAFAQAGQTLLSALDGESPLVGHSKMVAAVVDDLAKSVEPEWVTSFDTDEARIKFAAWQHNARTAAGTELVKLFNTNLFAMLDVDAVEPHAGLTRLDGGSAWSVRFDNRPGSDDVVWSQIAARAVLPEGDAALDIEWAKNWFIRRGLSDGNAFKREQLGMLLAGAQLSAMANAFQRHFGPSPLFLPAGRTGLLSIRHLTTLEGISGGLKLRGNLVPFLPQLIRASSVPDGELSGVVDEIEQLLHGGRIVEHSAHGVVPNLTLERGGRLYPMERSSSSVSELAAVTYLLRKLGRPGATVIIEEPEAHLHPSKQVHLALALARLVRAGVRVLVTTHSEFLVDTLAWAIRSTEMGVASEPLLTPDTSLHASEVAIYRFHERKVGAGYTASEVPFDIDDGFDRSEFTDVAGDLYSRHARLTRKRAKRSA